MSFYDRRQASTSAGEEKRERLKKQWAEGRTLLPAFAMKIVLMRQYGFSLLLLLLTAQSAAAQCYGFGADTPGGQDKPIVYVTNLKNSGPGSLRAAVAQGNRQVHFQVAGTITLSSELTIKSAFLTVDGLTAPSPGITLNGRGIIIRGPQGHDIVLRGLRVRNAWPKDGIWITDAAHHVVLDQLSVHNSQDGNLDITRKDTRDIAVCNSIFAQPAGEEKNSLLAVKSTRLSFYQNLFIASQQRSPQVTFDDSDAKT